MPALASCSSSVSQETSFHRKSPEACSTLAAICAHRSSSCSGHTHCGAVAAALDTLLRGSRQHSRIQLLVDCILPALLDLDTRLTPEMMRAQGIEANVRWSMRQILESPEGRERQTEGHMKLVGAIYELETGRVRFLE